MCISPPLLGNGSVKRLGNKYARNRITIGRVDFCAVLVVSEESRLVPPRTSCYSSQYRLLDTAGWHYSLICQIHRIPTKFSRFNFIRLLRLTEHKNLITHVRENHFSPWDYNQRTKTEPHLCGLEVKSTWLQIRRSRRYQIFWEVLNMKRGSLSLVRMRSYLNGKVAAPGLENRH
jgi:hypothetical protein